MANTEPLSPRELEVAKLLIQGKSNKQIALELEISVHTVEFHTQNIYDKLGVDSRSAAIVKLMKILGQSSPKPGESSVAEPAANGDNRDGSPPHQGPAERTKQFFRKYWILVLAVMPAALLIAYWITTGWPFMLQPPAPTPTPTSTPTSTPTPFEGYERECEYPDAHTVGQMIWREKASSAMVHGQFGTTASSPYPAKSGYVIYNDVILQNKSLVYLKLLYSKNSPASVPILIYLDEEQVPRARLSLVNQNDWDKFAWTNSVSLQTISGGRHSIKFQTDGQEYGVADLDKFVLSASP